MYMLHYFIDMFMLMLLLLLLLLLLLCLSSTALLKAQDTQQQQQIQQRIKQHRILNDEFPSSEITKTVRFSEMIFTTNTNYDNDAATGTITASDIILQSEYTYSLEANNNNNDKSTSSSSSYKNKYFIPTRVMLAPKSWSNLCGQSIPNETILEIKNYYTSTINKNSNDNNNKNNNNNNIWLLLNITYNYSNYYYNNINVNINNNNSNSNDCMIAEKVYNVQLLNDLMLQTFGGATNSPRITKIIILQQKQTNQQKNILFFELRQQLVLGSFSSIEVFLADLSTSILINNRIQQVSLVQNDYNKNQTTSTNTNNNSVVINPYFLSPDSIDWSYYMGQVIDFNNDFILNDIDMVEYYNASPPQSNNNTNSNNYNMVILICTILSVTYLTYFIMVAIINRRRNRTLLEQHVQQQQHLDFLQEQQQHRHHYNFTVPTTTTTNTTSSSLLALSESDFALLPQMTYHVNNNNNNNNTNTDTSTDSNAPAIIRTSTITTTSAAVAAGTVVPVVPPSPLQQVQKPGQGRYNNYEDKNCVEMSNVDYIVPAITSYASQKPIDVDEIMDMLEQQTEQKQKQQEDDDDDDHVGTTCTVLSSNNMDNVIDCTNSTKPLKVNVSPEAVAAVTDTAETTTTATTTTTNSDNNNNNSDNNNNNNTCCSICLEEFCNNEIITALPRCCHKFHTVCIKQWLLQQKSIHCPLCKTIVLIK